MLLVTLQRVVKAMQEHSMAFWIIYDGKTEVDRMQEPETSVDVSIQKLQDVFTDLSGQMVIVKVSTCPDKDKAKLGRGYKSYEYNVKLSGAPVDGMAGLGGGNVVLSLLNKINDLNASMLKQQYDNSIKEMERRLDEMKAEKSSFSMETLLNKAIELIGNNPAILTGKASPVASSLAGTPEAETVHRPTEDENKKMRAALVRLTRLDNNLPETLTALADFAEKNPEKYHSYIPFLKNL